MLAGTPCRILCACILELLYIVSMVSIFMCRVPATHCNPGQVDRDTGEALSA